MMVGREVFLNIEKIKADIGKPILEIKDVWTSGEKEMSKIRGVSFDVREGEIVGIAGVDGNGQSELVEAIAGLRRVEKGKILLGGKDITNYSPKMARQAGLTHIPEDRNLRGLNRALTIEDNLIAWKFEDAPFTKGIVRRKKEVRRYAEKLIKQFDIRPTEPDVATQSLSGGNAQKIVVAREVDADGKLLIASQPSRGVDIGAIESIRKILNDVKKSGKGILLVSADLEEVLALSDRIVVMYEGRIMGIVDSEYATTDNVGLLMLGEVQDDRDKEVS